ncbi:hypothetical protein VAA_03988 [Vibrio anguillarum 775]|nr:hypothetical protein VAA_03988 [Vibrio anguillarum 775]ARV25863.1 hypothetical protein A6A12_0441 [Vibrio anguillarum]
MTCASFGSVSIIEKLYPLSLDLIEGSVANPASCCVMRDVQVTKRPQ